MNKPTNEPNKQPTLTELKVKGFDLQTQQQRHLATIEQIQRQAQQQMDPHQVAVKAIAYDLSAIEQEIARLENPAPRPNAPSQPAPQTGAGEWRPKPAKPATKHNGVAKAPPPSSANSAPA